MNDKLIFESYLLMLKSTVEVYIHGTIESSNYSIRNILKTGLDETLKHQSRVFDEMSDYGWYNMENIKPEVINKTYTSLSN